MTAPDEFSRMTDEAGLTFLELMAHNLTIAVRVAAGRRQPMGPLTEEQTRLAMYWINEALHNVVQLTRELRLERERWSKNEIWKWIALWRNYKYASEYVEWAIQQSIEEMAKE